MVHKRIVALLMLLVLVLPVLAACGSEEATPTTGTTTGADTATSAPATEPTAETGSMATPEATAETSGSTDGSAFRVGLVTDVGKVTDGTFNQYAYEGLKRAEQEFGVQIDYIETVNSADYEKNIDQFATQDYDLIIGVGFLMGDGIRAAAAKYPDINFAIVDFAYEEQLPNVRGMVFAEDEAAFMVGALAAQMSKTGTIGAVGGVEIPPVQKLLLGYEAGARYINPDINVAQIYIPSFTDPAQGAEAAKNQIAEGADVIFGAGGQTGSGAIQAAAEQGVYVIGVDQDEYFTTFKGGPAPKLLSSALKRVDNAVFDTVKMLVEGSFEPGTYVGTAANGGVDFAPYHDTESEIPADVQAKVEEIKQGLADGTIKTGVTLP